MIILPELPKTAVGKVFKPDLRERSITFVFYKALSEAGLGLRVSDVVDDKHRGLVAQNAGDRAAAGENAVSAVLGDFIQQREWSGAEAAA